jgi:hypothetical protein
MFLQTEATVGLLLPSLPVRQFIRGGFFIADRSGRLIYFEEDRKGLITEAESSPSSASSTLASLATRRGRQDSRRGIEGG